MKNANAMASCLCRICRPQTEADYDAFREQPSAPPMTDDELRAALRHGGLTQHTYYEAKRRLGIP